MSSKVWLVVRVHLFKDVYVKKILLRIGDGKWGLPKKEDQTNQPESTTYFVAGIRDPPNSSRRASVGNRTGRRILAHHIRLIQATTDVPPSTHSIPPHPPTRPTYHARSHLRIRSILVAQLAQVLPHSVELSLCAHGRVKPPGPHCYHVPGLQHLHLHTDTGTYINYRGIQGAAHHSNGSHTHTHAHTHTQHRVHS